MVCFCCCSCKHHHVTLPITGNITQCTPSVCLSLCATPVSSGQRELEIDGKAARVTCNSPTSFEVKRSKVKVTRSSDNTQERLRNHQPARFKPYSVTHKRMKTHIGHKEGNTGYIKHDIGYWYTAQHATGAVEDVLKCE